MLDLQVEQKEMVDDTRGVRVWVSLSFKTGETSKRSAILVVGPNVIKLTWKNHPFSGPALSSNMYLRKDDKEPRYRVPVNGSSVRKGSTIYFTWYITYRGGSL